MKIFFVFLCLFLSEVIFGQSVREIYLSITDTVIVVKKSKYKHRYSAKVNVEIYAPNLRDTLLLYSFNKFVPTDVFVSNISFDKDKKTFMGLLYILEDNDKQIMQAEGQICLGSFKKFEDEIRSINKRPFVTSKQKIKYILLNDIDERLEYDRAKYEISNKTQSLVLFPLIGEYHSYLPKGEYYIYFIYSFLIKWGDTNSFVSNKVKLIVK